MKTDYNITKVFLGGLLVFLLLLPACRQKSRFAIDTDHAPQVCINRFDRDLISIDTADVAGGVCGLYGKYPDFFPVYISNVLQVSPADTSLVTSFIASFLTDTAFMPVNEAVRKEYGEIDDLERSLSTAYAYLRHYFPGMALPEPYFFVSGFNLSVLMEDNMMGMGTDMYLGVDFPAYRELTYQYIVNNMKRESIIPDMVSALLFSVFRPDGGQGRLLDEMLYRGKVMYLLSVCMPDEKDEHLIGYTQEQQEWCRRHERQIWASVIDQKHLFSSDRFLIRKYMNEAPFTSTISQDSPGRLGTWIGWQIVRSYMYRNEEVSLLDLMQENDYQKILEESGYRP